MKKLITLFLCTSLLLCGCEKVQNFYSDVSSFDEEQSLWDKLSATYNLTKKDYKCFHSGDAKSCNKLGDIYSHVVKNEVNEEDEIVQRYWINLNK